MCILHSYIEKDVVAFFKRVQNYDGMVLGPVARWLLVLNETWYRGKYGDVAGHSKSKDLNVMVARGGEALEREYSEWTGENVHIPFRS